MEERTSKENIFQKLNELKNQIQYHNYLYHVLDQPVISDSEFDRLMAELRRIEFEYPEFITPDSPSQRVGAKPSEKFVKVTHPASILSLANAFNRNDIYAWIERISKIQPAAAKTDFVVEPKIDGLTVVLHYQDGVFVLGATRGDGDIGEDVTANLRTIKALPLRIPVFEDTNLALPRLVVRGEVFISVLDFNELNKKLLEESEKIYLNPRNTAAGSLRQLDSSLTARRPLNLLVYDIIVSEGYKLDTHIDLLEFLRKLGFPVVESTYCSSIESISETYDKYVNERDLLAYETDGIVIKINNRTLSDSLGVAGKDPRGAIAFKFPAQEVTTQLIDIGLNVGRTGVITPFAMLEPVQIGGVVVKQATLHNFEFIEEKDIRIGDRVAVKRAGDVIPYVIGPIKNIRTGDEIKFKLPEFCPVCNQPLEKSMGEVAWYCVNSSCPAQLVRNLEHFASRGAMEIVGLGIKIVEQLVDNRLVKDVGDLYGLEKEQLLQLEGFAEKKAENLIESIVASKRQTLDRLINALGIKGVGEVAARDLAVYFTNLDTLSRATFYELQGVEGIGPNIAQAIIDWFSQPPNREILKKLRKSGVWPEYKPTDIAVNKSLTIYGKTIVITGTLSGYSRDEVKKMIEGFGGRVVDTISSKTDYLVLGENPGSKYAKAVKLGTKIISESDLLNLVA